MSFMKVCDHCHRVINSGEEWIRADYHQSNTNWITKDFHVDCFNYKFSCDIRKMVEMVEKKGAENDENSD